MSGEAETRPTDILWRNDKPPISDAMRRILVEYSHIPESELVTHVEAIRENAWKTFKYPTIGLFAFIILNGPQLPQYPAALERLTAGETLLDLGCCVGQELRKMIVDGAPQENVAGAEMHQAFIDNGYDLFNDRTRLKSRFYIGDIFSEGHMGIKPQSFDMIMAIYFFHLFTWDEQVAALTKAVELLKRKPGSMIFGRQFGLENARVFAHYSTRSGDCFAHSDRTWNELVQKVAGTLGMTLNVEADLGEECKPLGGDFRWLRFCITVG